ncbi:MAG: thioredoxin family protein [Planctomycetota bacterium]|nr:MAG: thioredoxin family protein [Planctomycetota bacterium]
MPPLQSTSTPLGTRCPPFDLCDPRGFRMSNADAAGRPLLVAFICNHCPFIKHIREELSALGREYMPKGLAIAAISSNDPVLYPDDGPLAMVREACEAGYCFPYLFDSTQEIARAFDAQCTPDLYLFDAAHRLAYRGQLCESRPRSGIPVTGRDLRAAIDAVLEGRPPLATQVPSVGCSIKWRNA